jgi:hypothetical protein
LTSFLSQWLHPPLSFSLFWPYKACSGHLLVTSLCLFNNVYWNLYLVFAFKNLHAANFFFKTSHSHLKEISLENSMVMARHLSLTPVPQACTVTLSHWLHHK